MLYTALLFLLCILAGFSLLNISAIPVLSGLAPFLEIAAALVILIFTTSLLYLGFKKLFSKTWR
ncbi:hypothetical protein [Bacillus sp. B15-48]|uniref:hypothetical protein n=1 Tax=Bacillus sp. B15-48 TaxID=1548601 RepID=UPI00193F8B98|nr:hypothetical protein [Bacillus sp. B15-48]MBM4760695.1 hypothetical protein [Bacillus sp. B15-48]